MLSFLVARSLEWEFHIPDVYPFLRGSCHSIFSFLNNVFGIITYLCGHSIVCPSSIYVF